jgi:hypothetical protein
MTARPGVALTSRATVIDLESRRPAGKPCCPRCSLRALVERVASHANTGELLIPASLLVEIAQDVSATVTDALIDRSAERTRPGADSPTSRCPSGAPTGTTAPTAKRAATLHIDLTGR